jgi:hypothetical protein
MDTNQADVEERNRQVRLMAYTYTRGRRRSPSGWDQSKKFLPELQELCNRPCWRRVWIVQKIGAATQVRVHRVNESASWGRFFQQVSTYADRQIAPATRLFRSRQGRHGDSFLLANPIEACQDSLCEEPRDKVSATLASLMTVKTAAFPLITRSHSSNCTKISFGFSTET